MNYTQEIELKTTVACSLYTLLFIEQRVYAMDADYNGDRHAKISTYKDRVGAAIWSPKYENPATGWVSAELEAAEWDDIEDILERQCDLQGAFDNEFAHQNALTTIAQQLHETIVEKRETYHEGIRQLEDYRT